MTAILCKERINPDEITGKQDTVSFWTALKAIFRNKYWFDVLAIIIVVAGVFTTTMQMHTYYAKYILGNLDYTSWLNSAYIIPAFILGFILIPVSKHYTAKRIVLVGVVVQTIGNGLITVMLGFIMSAVGYDGLKSVRSAQTLSGITNIYLFIPFILSIVEIVLVLLHDLDKKFDSIMKDLNERSK